MGVKFTLTQGKRDALKRLLQPKLVEAANRIEGACNAESSWGFYRAYAHEGVTRVAVLNQGSDARTNRLLRNLEAGRVR